MFQKAFQRYIRVRRLHTSLIRYVSHLVTTQPPPSHTHPPQSFQHFPCPNTLSIGLNKMLGGCRGCIPRSFDMSRSGSFHMSREACGGCIPAHSICLAFGHHANPPSHTHQAQSCGGCIPRSFDMSRAACGGCIPHSFDMSRTGSFHMRFVRRAAVAYPAHSICLAFGHHANLPQTPTPIVGQLKKTKFQNGF